MVHVSGNQATSSVIAKTKKELTSRLESRTISKFSDFDYNKVTTWCRKKFFIPFGSAFGDFDMAPFILNHSYRFLVLSPQGISNTPFT